MTRAKVTGDLSLARVYWTIIGDAAERKKTHKALERATGLRPPPAGQRLSLRRVPEVKFIFDESVAAQDRGSSRSSRRSTPRTRRAPWRRRPRRWRRPADARDDETK